MSLPCPHCGSSQSHAERTAGDFKPIVPREIQGNFAEPPPPNNTMNSVSDPSTGTLPTCSTSPLSPTTQLKEFPPSVPSTALIRPTSSSRLEDPLISASPSIAKPARAGADSASKAAKAARETPAIEDRLEKIEASIGDLGKEIKSIIQIQKVIEMILKKMWEKEKDVESRD
ncbi:MAG: hypothetical protein ACE5OZ_20370 [Candidatus Heimdallarchaeota archaeon]